MKTLLKFLLPVIVLALALLITSNLIKSRRPPAKAATVESIVRVEVLSAHKVDLQPLIQIAGTVIPSQQVEIRAQVGGEIIEMAANLQPGGMFEKGAELVRIDGRDFNLAIQRRQADVERARFELLSEQGQASVASREWELLGKELETSEAGKEMSLRLPHLRRSKANLAAMESSLEEAGLALERTRITAPFNGQIRMEQVDLGQVITPQMTIATLTGTDRYWVRASVPVEHLANLALPNRKEEGGAMATVIMSTGASEIRWQGRIVQLLGDLEQSGRLARILIAVDNPLGLGKEPAGLPLLLDAFVTVEINGNTLKNVVTVPSHTLHEGDKLYVVNADDRLEIRTVKTAWRERDRVLISEGLAEGDRVVSSRIPTPVPGLKLLVQNKQEAGDLGGKSE